GALSIPVGRVDIGWQVDADKLTLRWAESHGPQVAVPQRSGFGTQVLKFALQHELQADVDINYDPSGLCFTARLPLTLVDATVVAQCTCQPLPCPPKRRS